MENENYYGGEVMWRLLVGLALASVASPFVLATAVLIYLWG